MGPVRAKTRCLPGMPGGEVKRLKSSHSGLGFADPVDEERIELMLGEGATAVELDTAAQAAAALPELPQCAASSSDAPAATTIAGADDPHLERLAELLSNRVKAPLRLQ